MLKRFGRQTIIKTTGVPDSVYDIALGNKNVKFCSAIIVDVSSLYFENYHRTRIEKSQNKSQKI